QEKIQRESQKGVRNFLIPNPFCLQTVRPIYNIMGLFCAGFFFDEGSKSVGSISHFEGNHYEIPH
ncbi:hypothetical protein AB1L16_23750, partial [Peribacillus frigoritolerans]